MTASADDGAVTSPEAPLRQLPFLAGLLSITASTLALEVLDTRLLSVLTWYSLAFLVIAMGLFGLTAGAVRVYLKADDYLPERIASSLARDARLMAYAVAISYVALLLVPLRVAGVATTVPLFVVFSAAIALPFYPAGLVVAAAVTRSPFPVGRVYAVDLAGAALGAPAVPWLLRGLGGGSAILSMGALAALGSVCFAWAGRDRRALRAGAIALLCTGALAGANRLTDHGLVPLWVKGVAEDRDKVELEVWNSHSRVQVLRPVRSPAVFWGKGANCTAPVILQRDVVIDGHAASPMYLTGRNWKSLDFLRCDVTNVVHHLRPGGDVAIIGVGGSRDIQAALLFGHERAVGIELNDHLLDVLVGPYGKPTGVPGDPRVELVNDEARSWLARSDRKFQVIQASLIDTWAATGAGAHALGENGLYTLQAWDLFLEHLEPGGVFTVSRWSTVETARLVALAVGALVERGAQRPRDHIALLAAGPVSTLLVGKSPLTSEDVRRLDEVAQRMGFALIVAPGKRTTAERLERVLDATSMDQVEDAALLPLLDFRPPSDDRPFFFNVIRLGALYHPLPAVTAGSIEGNLLATRALGLAFVASLVLVAIAVALPLARRARPEHRTGRGLWAAFGYFSAIGIGFMLAEIALLQRLSLILGHPSYSLIVVLSSLVGAAGLGSFLSDKLPLDRAPACYLFPVVLAGGIVSLALFWPQLTGSVASASTFTRIAFAVGVTGPLGVGLGFAFPAGIRLARAAHDAETPWLWGLNGMGSVLASSAAILIALQLGLTALLLVSAAFYLLLVPAVFVMRRRARQG